MITKGAQRAGQRALLHATGVPPQELGKPLIGLASSFTDLVPGHVHMRSLERAVEKGVHSAGGYCFIFGVPAICDGITMGHEGMHYSLPSRELIADAIESVCQAHALDGLVLLTNCDKITPGMLMAAARLDVPAVILTAGPMLCGRVGAKRLTLVRDTFEAVGRYQAGLISDQELAQFELRACPGPGSCQGLYTANTMACVTEALGMSLPGCATALAGMSKKEHIAYSSGERVVELVRRNVSPSDIMTPDAFVNAVTVDMALGGSTNTVLHVAAVSSELGRELELGFFEAISDRTPHIVDLQPGGEDLMEDLEYAGGIPAVMKRLQGMLADCPTVSGRSIHEIAASAELFDEKVIRPVDKPYHAHGGIAVLRGTLAPEGALIKRTAVPEGMAKFEGRAQVFEGEDAAMRVILAGRIPDGSVVVIRGEGPKGGPGMREMLSPTSAIVGMGRSRALALVTDGRFSGGTHGFCVGHVAPESAVGGPIALVADGDRIKISLDERRIDLEVDERVLEARRKSWSPPPPRFTRGYLARYAAMVQSAAKGAVVRPRV